MKKFLFIALVAWNTSVFSRSPIIPSTSLTLVPDFPDMRVQFGTESGLLFDLSRSFNLSTWHAFGGGAPHIGLDGNILEVLDSNAMNRSFGDSSPRSFYRLNVSFNHFSDGSAEVSLLNGISTNPTSIFELHPLSAQMGNGLIEVRNSGDLPLTIQSVLVNGDFRLVAPVPAQTISSLNSINFEVVAKSLTPGGVTRRGVLLINTNDSEEPVKSFAVVQESGAAAAAINKNPVPPPQAVIETDAMGTWILFQESYVQNVLIPQNLYYGVTMGATMFDDIRIFVSLQPHLYDGFDPWSSEPVVQMRVLGGPDYNMVVADWGPAPIAYPPNNSGCWLCYARNLNGYPGGWASEKRVQRELLKGEGIKVEIMVNGHPDIFTSLYKWPISRCRAMWAGPNPEVKNNQPIRLGVVTHAGVSSKWTLKQLEDYSLTVRGGFESLEPFKKYKDNFVHYIDMKPFQEEFQPATEEDVLTIKKSSSCGRSKSVYIIVKTLGQDPNTHLTCGEAASNHGLVWVDSSVKCTRKAETAMHETGHAFANLADQYISRFRNGAAHPWDVSIPEISRANCTQNKNAYINNGIPFEAGCGSFPEETRPPDKFPFYRPNNKSIMASEGPNFDVVSCGAIRAAMRGENLNSLSWQGFAGECRTLVEP